MYNECQDNTPGNHERYEEQHESVGRQEGLSNARTGESFLEVCQSYKYRCWRDQIPTLEDEDDTPYQRDQEEDECKDEVWASHEPSLDFLVAFVFLRLVG